MKRFTVPFIVGILIPIASPAYAQTVGTGFSFSTSTTTLGASTRDITSTTTRDVTCTACFDNISQTASASASGNLTLGTTSAQTFDAAGADFPSASSSADPTTGVDNGNATSSATFSEELVTTADLTLNTTTTDTTAQTIDSATITTFGGSTFAQ